MDEDRLLLHSRIQSIFPTLKLYFRPPSKLLLEYPCVVYDVIEMPTTRANNGLYSVGTTFSVTLMSKIPGIKGIHDMLQVPHARHTRSFVSSDIVHDIFTIEVK